MLEPSTSTGSSPNSYTQDSSSRMLHLEATSDWLPTDESDELGSSACKESPASCLCCECDARYLTQWELLRHVRAVHPRTRVIYVCWHCEREFTKFYRLLLHVTQGHAGRERLRRRAIVGTPRVVGASTSRSPGDDDSYGEYVEPSVQPERSPFYIILTAGPPLEQ